MKRIISLMLAIVLSMSLGLFVGCNSKDNETTNKENDNTEYIDQENDIAESTNDNNLGDYKLEILGARLSQDSLGKNIVLIKYKFTNNANNPKSFVTAFSENVYQNGIGLNEALVVNDYDLSAKWKEIQPGATYELEIAYKLEDTTSDVQVEVRVNFGVSGTVIKKTFSIA